MDSDDSSPQTRPSRQTKRPIQPTSSMSPIAPETTIDKEDKIPVVTPSNGNSSFPSSSATTSDEFQSPSANNSVGQPSPSSSFTPSNGDSTSPSSSLTTSDGFQSPSAASNNSVDQSSPSGDASVTADIDDSSKSSPIPMADAVPSSPSSGRNNQTGPFSLPTPAEPPVSYPTPDVPDNPSPRPRPTNGSNSKVNEDPATNLDDKEDPSVKPQKVIRNPQRDTSPPLGKGDPDLDVDLPIQRPSQIGLNFDIDSNNTIFHMPINPNNEGESETGIHWFEADVELPVCNEKSFLDEKVKCRAVLESLGETIVNRGKKIC